MEKDNENMAISQTEEFDKLIEKKYYGDELYAAEYTAEEDIKLIFNTVIDKIDKIAGMIMHNITIGKLPTYYWMGLLCHYMNMICIIKENNKDSEIDIDLDHKLISAVSDLLSSGLPIVFQNVEQPSKKEAKIIKFKKGDIENG